MIDEHPCVYYNNEEERLELLLAGFNHRSMAYCDILSNSPQNNSKDRLIGSAQTTIPEHPAKCALVCQGASARVTHGLAERSPKPLKHLQINTLARCLTRSGLIEMQRTTDSFFLQLSEPHSQIIITGPRLEDAQDIPAILNDERVYPWMGAGLPYPHKHEHALRWLDSVKPRCDIGQGDVRAVSDTSPAGPRFISECPVRIIREVTDGREVYLGDCGITRWYFVEVADKQQREVLTRENMEKLTGDPTIIWTIGDYLAPSHHGRGIMKSVIGTLLSWAATNMNVRHMRTTAIEGNEPSVKVLQRNGFKIERTLPEFALKKGERVGLHVLEWKATS